MSSTDITRPRMKQSRIPRLVHRAAGLCLLTLPVGCGTDGNSNPTPMGGAPGSAAGQPGAAGSGAGAPSSQGGSAGQVTPAGGASASAGAAGAAGGGSATAGAAGQTAGLGGAGGGSSVACAFQCVAQCTEAGGTKKDGTCSGAQICCDGATSTPANPLAHLVPAAKEVGLLLANRFSKQALTFTSMADLPGDGYKVACEWYGALGVAKSTSTQTLLDSLVKKFDPLKANFVTTMLAGQAHVDRYIFGIVPLEIYLQIGDESYLPLGIQVADKQHTTNQVRNAIDDMFMMTILQLEAYRTKKEDKYLKFMAPIMVTYLKAQKDNGLFFHNDSQGPVHWGRGNGWFAAGMAEMLKDLPKTAPEYATIEAGYKKMMAGLLKFQSKNGLWYQVLNLPEDSKNWEESSGSAMFTYAMISGVRRGLLDAATYVPVIDAAWAGLRKKISSNGDVSDICIGTWYKANAQEYMGLTRLTGDGHGQAPILWAT
ncbi:MAG TPA: glycoside hydrolase family 88 protein, partial [Polyangiaceae bacterium]|nr:glycoside hydrolase family 88 protein [Polyangiaceae bacterium]